jgi:hypothetical protein
VPSVCNCVEFESFVPAALAFCASIAFSNVWRNAATVELDAVAAPLATAAAVATADPPELEVDPPFASADVCCDVPVDASDGAGDPGVLTAPSGLVPKSAAALAARVSVRPKSVPPPVPAGLSDEEATSASVETGGAFVLARFCVGNAGGWVAVCATWGCAVEDWAAACGESIGPDSAVKAFEMIDPGDSGADGPVRFAVA